MAKKKEAEEKQRPTKLLLYVGLYEGGSSKMHHVYVEVGSTWHERTFPAERMDLYDDFLLYNKRFGFARPGSVVRIEHKPDDETTLFGGTAKAEGYIDDETATAWRVASDAAKTANDIKRNAKKEGRRDLQLELLEPIRTAYRGLRNRNQRTAILARVMAYVTG